MLNSTAILNTLFAGCNNGIFVLRLARPDTTTRTFWREDVDERTKTDGALEVTLPEHASLTRLEPELLHPNVLPGLWDTYPLTFGHLCSYFAGETVEDVAAVNALLAKVSAGLQVQ